MLDPTTARTLDFFAAMAMLGMLADEKLREVTASVADMKNTPAEAFAAGAYGLALAMIELRPQVHEALALEQKVDNAENN